MRVDLVINPDTRITERFSFDVEDVVWECFPDGANRAYSSQDRYERESDVIPTLFLNSLVVRPHYVTIIDDSLYVSVITL